MSKNLEPMTFDSLDLAEVPIKVGDKDFILREASGKAAVAWRNARTDAIRLKDGKPVGAKNLASVDPLLVSLCLFDSEGNGVPLATILGWPDRVQKQLYDRVKLISNISELGEGVEALKAQRKLLDEQIESIEEKAKNSEETTEDGSD